MQFPKANSFPKPVVLSKIMGPNPLKLCEEMLAIADECVSGKLSYENDLDALPAKPFEETSSSNTLDPSGRSAVLRSGALTETCLAIPSGSVVLDLGSGTGITTALLAREYGLVAYGADLWSDPSENMRFFESLGLSNHNAIPVKVDASKGLPFAEGFFDAVVSTDSYNYFGRDPEYLDAKLLPYVKRGGLVALCFPGMKRDCHENPPSCLLESWTPEQLDYIHDIPWWHALLQQSSGAEILEMREMTCTEEAWADWLECENGYAKGDAAAVRAGALEYLNAIAVVLRRK